MIKSLKKYQVQLTPFEATKNWALNNIDNDHVLLTEDDYPIALEFLDYGGLYPEGNYGCDIALEQQGTDLAVIEEGLNVTGIFYPYTEPTNIDGTYKRSIYHQVKTMFYNAYLDPTKIWGSENIDFELSKTKRMLTDQFRLFDIPRMVFGDKLTPKSIIMYDNTLDNDYVIKDDGNGNLLAGINLFSHQQEVGEYKNIFIENESSSYCDYYWYLVYNEGIIPISVSEVGSLGLGFAYGGLINGPSIPIETSGSESGSFTIGLSGGSIVYSTIISDGNNDSGSINTGILNGNLDTFPPPVITSSFDMGLQTGSLVYTIVTVSGSYDSRSLSLGFQTGSIYYTIITTSGSYDSRSLSLGFQTGLIYYTIITTSGSYDSRSLSLGFQTGSIITTVTELDVMYDSSSINVGFTGGSLV